MLQPLVGVSLKEVTHGVLPDTAQVTGLALQRNGHQRELDVHVHVGRSREHLDVAELVHQVAALHLNGQPGLQPVPQDRHHFRAVVLIGWRRRAVTALSAHPCTIDPVERHVVGAHFVGQVG
ncbi:hypothetical protein D3C72_1527070 [compost metagenome]